ncbi:hypothetical protein EXIGLDRAFT_845788 [Exidia glandulosa HHB12029]|uniref:Membrane anchor Opy2 N-terminal domain-containing protein n=1 Tax=Exidia glandulosa HHB12029 TaxID=1314781 RepID=A0A165Z7S7_EXIGL|nr:hypothetical protein EXIGLDRAFT_845788 [Exidia glandulosa HHB12029]
MLLHPRQTDCIDIATCTQPQLQSGACSLTGSNQCPMGQLCVQTQYECHKCPIMQCVRGSDSDKPTRPIPSSPVPSDTAGNTPSTLSGKEIAALVVGAVCFVLLVGVVLVIQHRRKRRGASSRARAASHIVNFRTTAHASIAEGSNTAVRKDNDSDWLQDGPAASHAAMPPSDHTHAVVPPYPTDSKQALI